MSKTSLPLKNLRGVLLLLIVAFHSFSAYIVTQPTTPPAFDLPPYDWRVFPIIDNERWLGFDLFCAFQFLYLMQFMFFLSGLFVWPSLQRKGWKGFLAHRLVRLGIPFLIGVYLVMPIAFYPVYRVTAVDPSWSSFWAHWTALPITPTGPMWFLWFLLALDFCAAAIFKLASGGGGFVADLIEKITQQPRKLFVIVICITALAYLPLSALYSPWYWAPIGPFEVQATFAPQYAIYFFVGLAIGAQGLDRGIFDEEGTLVRRWPLWTAGAFAAFFLWIIPSALIAKVPNVPVKALSVIGDLGLVIFAAAACLSMTGLFQRFARGRLPVIGDISEHGYGVYFFHYPILLWLQYALLDQVMPAVAKGMLVLIGTVLASWGASVLTDRVLTACRPLFTRGVLLLGAELGANGRFSVSKLFD
jgi:peptidoglycan/LPS O-acetylase OafA/YrhL